MEELNFDAAGETLREMEESGKILITSLEHAQNYFRHFSHVWMCACGYHETWIFHGSMEKQAVAQKIFSLRAEQLKAQGFSPKRFELSDEKEDSFIVLIFFDDFEEEESVKLHEVLS